MRYELTDYEWSAIKPILPNKPRGVPRVNDRRVLNGIFWVLRSGAPWRDLPENYGPYTTCYNRFVRWRRAGIWDQIMETLVAAHDKAVQMIDTSIVRVHQHAACIARNNQQSMGRSRGGLTSKIYVVVDTNGLPVRLGLTAGEAHDNRLALKLCPASSREQCCWLIVAMTPTGSEPLPPRSALGPTFRQGAIAKNPSASVLTFIAPETWSSAFSTRSSNVGGSRRAMTSSQQTISCLHRLTKIKAGRLLRCESCTLGLPARGCKRRVGDAVKSPCFAVSLGVYLGRHSRRVHAEHITPSAFVFGVVPERYLLVLAIRPPSHVECCEIPDLEQPPSCSNNARRSVSIL